MDYNFNKIVNRKNSNSVKWLVQKHQKSIPFWVADSDYPTSTEIIDALNDTSANTIFGYSIIPPLFFDAICNWYSRYNVSVHPSWISPLTGVIAQIRVILDLITKESDAVILQTPVYHTFHKLIKGMNRVIIENKLIKKNDTYIMDYDNLEKLFIEGHKVLILCSPHNPVGRMWTYEELEKVAKLAYKYNVYVISDEIHSDINITNRKFTSMLSFDYLYDLLYICNAPSKAFNIAGLSTSYAIIPNELLRENYNKKIERDALSKPTIFGVNALISAYTKGQNFIIEQNKHILNNYNYLLEIISQKLPLVKVTKLEATYLVWLDLSYLNKTNEEIINILSDAFITCSNGIDFCKDYGSYIRFNIACPKEQLTEGLNRLVGALNEIR